MEEEEFTPRTFESLAVEGEKLLLLKRILLALLEKITQRLGQLANEIDTIISVDMLKEKMKDCKRVIEAGKELSEWPIGEGTFTPKPLPTSITQQPKLIVFRKNTEQLIWELESKLGVIRDYLIVTDSIPKSVIVALTLVRLKKILFDAAHDSGIVSSSSPTSTPTTTLSSSFKSESISGPIKSVPETRPALTPLSTAKMPTTTTVPTITPSSTVSTVTNALILSKSHSSPKTMDKSTPASTKLPTPTIVTTTVSNSPPLLHRGRKSDSNDRLKSSQEYLPRRNPTEMPSFNRNLSDGAKFSNATAATALTGRTIQQTLNDGDNNKEIDVTPSDEKREGTTLTHGEFVSPRRTKKSIREQSPGAIHRVKAKDITKLNELPELHESSLGIERTEELVNKWDKVFAQPHLIRTSSKKRNEVEEMLSQKTSTLNREQRSRILEKMISHPELFKQSQATLTLRKNPLDSKTLIISVDGYPIDSGNPLLKTLEKPFKVLYQDMDYKHFAKEIMQCANHWNFMAFDEKNGPMILSIGVRTFTVEGENKESYSLIGEFRTKTETQRLIIPTVFTGKEKDDPKDALKKMLKFGRKDLSEFHWIHIKDTELDKKLMEFEKNEVTKWYKFGLLNTQQGQVDESEFYGNREISNDFQEFMDCIGEKIELKGWENWAGELDVRCNTTGTHSLYTMWQGYEIMFHVASFLPYSSVDPQQIERKRFIGNDIVVLIFKEGNTPFPPDVLHSHFNHVFIVVTPDYEMKKKTNKTFYRLSIACKEGVPPYPPDFPKDYLFEKGEEFREFLLVKLINAERAAIRQHPIFAKKMERTRKEILLSLYNQFCKKPKTNKLLSVK
jgi:hypothetical protein